MTKRRGYKRASAQPTRLLAHERRVVVLLAEVVVQTPRFGLRDVDELLCGVRSSILIA
jgi:hypothetical protein